MTNEDDAFEEFPSLCPPVVAAAATRRHRHRPRMLIRIFFWFPLKWYRLQIPVTLRWLWLLETIDNGEGRGDGGERGGGIFVVATEQEAQDGGPRARGGGVRHSKSHFSPLT
jgi:hypothetical protein